MKRTLNYFVLAFKYLIITFMITLKKSALVNGEIPVVKNSIVVEIPAS